MAAITGSRKSFGMRARESNALDSVDSVASAEELAEVGADIGREIAPPRVDVLTEQRDFPHAVACKTRDLGYHLARPPALLATSDGGNDAVRAGRVTAHRDLHPCLEGALSVGRQGRGKSAFVEAESRPRNSCAACAQPFAEVGDRTGSERDVDLGVELEDPIALCLGVAPARRR